nr:hypothetical protein [Priestia megaterium]
MPCRITEYPRPLDNGKGNCICRYLASPLAVSITGDVIPVTGGIGNTVYF